MLHTSLGSDPRLLIEFRRGERATRFHYNRRFLPNCGEIYMPSDPSRQRMYWSFANSSGSLARTIGMQEFSNVANVSTDERQSPRDGFNENAGQSFGRAVKLCSTASPTSNFSQEHSAKTNPQHKEIGHDIRACGKNYRENDTLRSDENSQRQWALFSKPSLPSRMPLRVFKN